jgi:hypothetical protein
MFVSILVTKRGWEIWAMQAPEKLPSGNSQGNRGDFDDGQRYGYIKLD